MTTGSGMKFYKDGELRHEIKAEGTFAIDPDTPRPNFGAAVKEIQRSNRELMQMALDVLVEVRCAVESSGSFNMDWYYQPVKALRDRLAQWEALDKMVAEQERLGMYDLHGDLRGDLRGNEDTVCKTHPDAPHGFDRNASHSEDRYVCECESWEPNPSKGLEMTNDEIIAETLRVYRNSLEGFIRFAIQQERQECALVCEEVMQKYKANTALNSDMSKIGEMSAELCALLIRKRGD